MGRKSVYTEEMAKEICTRIAEGESLRRICKDAHMPPISCVLKWAMDAEHPFADQYATSRRIQAELMIDGVLDIADDSANDFMMTEQGMKPNLEHINRTRLRVDTRKWIACKVLPKIYGDRLDHKIEGKLSLEDLVCGTSPADKRPE